jgi:N-acetyl-alpha-D-glucosaminyl L-malate synthase BshA
MKIANEPRTASTPSANAPGAAPTAKVTRPEWLSFDRVDQARRQLTREVFAHATRSPDQHRIRKPQRVGVLALGGMGGSGQVARCAANFMANAGHHVHLFSSRESFWRDEERHRGNLTPHAVPTPNEPREPDGDWVSVLANDIIEVCKRERLQVLQVHYAGGLLGAALLAKDALAREGDDVRIAVTLHGTDVTHWGEHPVHGTRLAAQLARADAVTAVSHWLAARATKVFDLKRSPTVIANAIELHHFNPTRWSNERRRIAPDGQAVLCHVSNMRAVKRPLDVVDTFAKVRASGLDAKLLLIGDGPMLADVNAVAEKLGVADDIVFVGPQPPELLGRYVAASDLMLVTSQSESFCLTAVEGMACGVPVVGSRCGGLDEVMQRVDAGVDRTSRLLHDVGDTESMAATAVALLTDEKRYLRVQRECFQVPLERYPQDRQARGYLALLDDLL